MNKTCKINNRILIPVLLFGFASLMFSCKKHYIEKHYTGTFIFTDNYQWWQLYQPTQYGTTVYTGKITFVTKDENGCSIKIQYASGSSITTYIDKKGTLSMQTPIHGGFSGTFSDNDHLSFSYSGGGLGGGSIENVTGVRQ